MGGGVKCSNPARNINSKTLSRLFSETKTSLVTFKTRSGWTNWAEVLHLAAPRSRMMPYNYTGAFLSAWSSGWICETPTAQSRDFTSTNLGSLLRDDYPPVSPTLVSCQTSSRPGVGCLRQPCFNCSSSYSLSSGTLEIEGDTWIRTVAIKKLPTTLCGFFLCVSWAKQAEAYLAIISRSAVEDKDPPQALFSFQPSRVTGLLYSAWDLWDDHPWWPGCLSLASMFSMVMMLPPLPWTTKPPSALWLSLSAEQAIVDGSI